MDIFTRDRLRKEAIMRGEPDPFPPKAAPPQPVSVAPPQPATTMSQSQFGKPFTDEEKMQQQKQLKALLRNRK